MQEYVKQLEEFIVERSDDLSRDEKKIFSFMKTKGERAVRGRGVKRHHFESRKRNGKCTLMMFIEGRQAGSVANSIMNKMNTRGDVEESTVYETKKGYKLIVEVKQ